MNKIGIQKWYRGLSLSTRILLGCVFLVAIITFGVIYIVEQDKVNTYNESLYHEMLHESTVLSRELNTDIDGMRKEVLFLSKTPPIQGIIRATAAGGYDVEGQSDTETWKQRLQNIFISLLTTNANAFQIRYIGVADGGRELVRVERSSTGYNVVTGKQLQRKGDRGYFKEAVELANGDVYLSDINLNREHGKIAIPHVRTLRAATPIYTDAGKLFGIVIINSNVGRILDNFSNLSSKNTQVYLMNEDDDYLVHPQRRMAFGFDLGTRHRWTDEVADIVDIETDQAQGDTEFFQANLLSRNMYVVKTPIYYDPSRPHRALSMALTIPTRFIETELDNVRNIAIVSGVLAMLVAGILIYGFVNRAFRPLYELTTAAGRISDGHYDTPMPAAESSEFTAFISAFDNMLDAIRKRESEILELNEVVNEREKYTNLVLETVPEAIFVIDSKGVITRANKFAETVFGYERDELIGQPVEMLIPNRFHHHAQLRNDYLASDPEQRTMGDTDADFHGRRKDGTEIFVEVGLGPVQIDGEKFVIASVQDVSQRKQMELDIKASAQELARSNKELEQFAYVASHDLQEPLRMVGSYVNLLEKRYRDKLDDDASEFIHYAVDGTKRMQTLITDLLDFSRIGRKELEFKPVDLNEVMKEILHDLQMRIRENHAVIDVPTLPTVSGDRAQIRQVLQNLVANGLKFQQENNTPRITITTRAYNEASDVIPEHVHLEEGSWISVRDNGVGFKQDYADQIFEIFKRLHNREQFEGTGIGLAICRKIIDRHGGYIHAESSPGEGAVFHILLPTAMPVLAANNGEISSAQSANM